MSHPGALTFYMLLFVCTTQGAILGVRLVNGTSAREGTVEYTEDNVTWTKICGALLDIEEVIVICRQLGYSGANRAITRSPFESFSDILPANDITCTGAETTLSECSIQAHTSVSCLLAGAAVCYDDNYLGCFVDRYDDRALPDRCNVTGSMLTIERCITCCNQSNAEDYVYAGVEFGNTCYCGTRDANYCRHGFKSDVQCNVLCSGKETESCGGHDHIAVFQIHSDTTSICTTDQPLTMTTTPTSITHKSISMTSNEQDSTKGLTSESITSSSSLTTVPLFTASQPSPTGNEIVYPASTDQGGTKELTTGSVTVSFLTTPPSLTSLHSTSENNMGLYAGIGVAVAVITTAIIVVLVFLTMRRRKDKREPQNADPYMDLDIKTTLPPATYEDMKLDKLSSECLPENNRTYENLAVHNKGTIVNINPNEYENVMM